MDQRERIADFQEGIRAAINGAFAGLWTAIPGIVQSFNSEQGTVVVQPSINARVLTVDPDDASQTTQKWVTLPQLLDVPVVFLGGGGFVATFPIANGDEALVIFASRCIDSWWQNGGIQNQAELRMHDLSDGFAIVGPRSLPKKIPGVSTTSAKLRTVDGTAYIELAAGGVINIVAPGGVNINGDVATVGAIGATKEITAKGTHTVSAHVHGGIQTGGGSTGLPTG